MRVKMRPHSKVHGVQTPIIRVEGLLLIISVIDSMQILLILIETIVLNPSH